MLEKIKQNKIYKWLDNYWYHYKWVTLVTVFFVTVFSVLTAQMLTKEKPDATVLYGGPATLTASQTADLQLCLKSALASDYNGDGKKIVELESIVLMTEEQLDEAKEQAAEDSNILIYSSKALTDNQTTFAQLLMSGEQVLLLVDPEQYPDIRDSGGIVPLSELFEPSEMPDCAYDDCAVVFSQTPFARYFTATQVLPDDTLLCVLRESENSIFKGKEKAEKQYRQQLLMYYKIINFSKGKNK